MSEYSPFATPEMNLRVLAEKPYPGRLLVIGFAGEIAVQAYAVEGRSEGSRNRKLVVEDNIVSTEIFDTSLSVGDPELTIYDAMRRVEDYHIVSNGSQTDRVVRYLRSGKTFEQAMKATEYEPDEPNFTPRISGYHQFDPDEGSIGFGISVIRKKQDGSTVRTLDDQDSATSIVASQENDNYGFCVHTYQGKSEQGSSEPLVSFDEHPFTIPVQDTAESMAEFLWENLDRKNRVAVVAKTIHLDGIINFYVINRHK